MKDEKVIQIAVASTPGVANGLHEEREKTSTLVALTDQGRMFYTNSRGGHFNEWHETKCGIAGVITPKVDL